VSDGKLSTKGQVTVKVNNLNDAPKVVLPSSLSVSELAVAGTAIGSRLTVTDEDVGDTASWTISTNNYFTISAAGQLSVKSGSALDYESATAVTVQVTVRDSASASNTRSLTVQVADANEAPTINAPNSGVFSIDENVAAGTKVT